MTFTKLLLVLILSSSTIFATPKVITKIELPRRLLKKNSQALSQLSQHIRCIKRIPWHNTSKKTPLHHELWIIEGTNKQSLQQLKNELKKYSFITKIEPYIPALGQSIHEHSNTPYKKLENTDLKRLIELKKRDVIVAILDTGIDRHHPALSQNISINTKEIINGQDDDNNGYIDDRYGYDFTGQSEQLGDPSDENGHGTHLAGIIAGKLSNQKIGLAPHVKLLNVKCLNDNQNGSQIDIAQAIKYAVDQGAEILNCSWAIENPSWILKEAIEYAINHNVIIVAAAGNRNVKPIIYPAAYENVIAVSALNNDRKLSKLANQNTAFDVAAFGENIQSSDLNQSYKTRSGTSQSAAIISATIAHILGSSRHPITSKTCKNILKNAYVIQKENNRNYKTINYHLLTQEILSYTKTPSLTLQSSTYPTHCRFWPNPASQNQGNFKITSPELNLNEEILIQIFNEYGKKIKHLRTHYNPNKHITWDLKNDNNQTLKNGTYFYIIKGEKSPKILKTGTLSILQNWRT
ncbi:MAG: S8 family serine peptidase [bacterium]